MQVAVRFSHQEEAQTMMKFLQKHYDYISYMEKYSIDAEKKVVFLSGEPTGMLRNVRELVIQSNWEESMPMQALYLYCWMAVKSSYRNENDLPCVYVMGQEFELCFNYQSINDTQKILVDPIGIPINDDENSIISYFTGGSKGIFNLINKKLQQRHTEHIEGIIRELNRASISYL